MRRAIQFLGLGYFLIALAACQQENPTSSTLSVGDTPPPLQISRWVRGEPLSSLEPGSVYIIDFWATWCAPCLESLPELDRLARDFGDQGLVAIALNVWEGEPAAVESFVASLADPPAYRVALDEPADSRSGQMAKSWLEAAGLNGIPATMIVDREGRLAWVGYSAVLGDDVIRQILSGEWDPALRERRRAELAGFQALAEAGDQEAVAMARRLADENPDNAVLLNEVAWTLITSALDPTDLPLAREIAEAAVASSDRADAAALDTLARVQFLQGETSLAISTQEEALGIATEPLQKSLRETLDSYRRGELPPA